MGTSTDFIVTSEIKFVEGVKLKTVKAFIFIFVLESYESYESHISHMVRENSMILTFHMPPSAGG